MGAGDAAFYTVIRPKHNKDALYGVSGIVALFGRCQDSFFFFFCGN